MRLNKFEIDTFLNPNRKSKTKYYYLRIRGYFKVVELNEGNIFGEIILLNKDLRKNCIDLYFRRFIFWNFKF